MATQEDQLKRDEATEEPVPAGPDGAARKLLNDVAKDRIARGDDDAQESATDFLLEAFNKSEPVEHTLMVNVGGVGDKRREIRWQIRSLPGSTIRKIREQAEQVVRRQQSGAGATSAGFRANVRIVVEGSVDPDIKRACIETGLKDPDLFLEEALENKQGLIDQIAGSILTLSGFDADDVTDAIEVRAAGNSSS